MNLSIKKFEELRLDQLYKILKLRFDVFVMEQNSIYDEFDNKDFNATHFYIEDKDEIIAYLRLCKNAGKIVSLGRIVIDKKYRRAGIGGKLVSAAIDYIKSELSTDKIAISAQDYLEDFYSSFGFITTSKVYLDGGVPHIDMELTF